MATPPGADAEGGVAEFSPAAPSGQPEECLAVVPGRRWAELPHAFRRLLVRNAVLTSLSPAVNAASGNHESPPTELSSGIELHTPPGESSSPELSGRPFSPASRAKGRSNVHTVGNFTRDFMELGMRGLSAPFATAAARWCDVFEHLVVAGEPAAAAARVSRLRHKTCDGQLCPAPDALGELFPELGELMRDGAGSLLSMSALPRTYAVLTTAFAGLCSTRMQLPRPAGVVADELGGQSLAAACKAYCRENAENLRSALQDVARAEESGDALAIEMACNKAIVLDPTTPEPFLARAGANLRNGSRWQCLEDLRMYLWWSTRKGFVLERHVSAYWRLAETFLLELDHRAARQGALLDDGTFHCFVDEAESSLRLACRFDVTGRLASSSEVQQLFRRIETHRAARRTAAELLDSPIVGDACTPEDDEEPGVEPLPKDHSVPWPIDLSAGLPDIALFSRFPDVGSSMKHDPMHLLFLDARGVLDLLTTVQSLALRTTAFAQRNPERLHWKHRPKPVHIHLQVPAAERLAHALLCIMIIKQVGSSVDAANGLDDASSGFPSFTMEETTHDRFLCALLTAVICCRTLSPPQRAEVDRLLTLLVLASMDENYMRRAFPWLELYDNHHSTFSAGVGEPESSDQGDSGSRSLVGSVPGEWGASLLLFRLQQIWLGWLATSGGEAAVQQTTSGPLERGRARLDAAAVHRAARELLLGPRAATLCASVDLVSAAAGGGGLSQRRLWAVTGHLPAGEVLRAGGPSGVAAFTGLVDTGEEESEDGEIDEDPVRRMRPADPRLRWRSLLEELAATPLDAWCLNPCAVDPVSWAYDPRSLADPFRSFSWCLRGGRRAGAGTCGSAPPASPCVESAWVSSPRILVETADLPLPTAGSDQPPAVEVIWEQMMAQIKAFSAVFNAAEAADSARARDMVPAQDEVEAPAMNAPGGQGLGQHTLLLPAPAVSASELLVPKAPRRAAAAGRPRRSEQGAGRLRQVAPGHVRISEELRTRIQLEAALARKEEILPGDVERELADLKRRRHEASLDLELRDYVMLASVRKKEGDWWGKDNQNSVAYKEAMDMGPVSTWNPAPAACAPIRLRICMYAGSHWQAAKTALRGLTFDAIDSRSLLVSGAGLLGTCTWLDSLLKPTPYSYIQTRLCEEVFLENLRLAASSSPAAAAPAAAAPAAAPPPLVGPLPTRGPEHLAAPGAQWPPLPASPRPRRAVLSKSGVVRWSSAPRSARPSAGLQLPAATSRPRGGCLIQGTKDIAERLMPPLVSRRSLKLQSLTGHEPPDGKKQRSTLEPSHLHYTAESLLFERLVHESVAAHMTGPQMQYLMGVTARAEPLWAELALDYLGARTSPVNRDFPPWDSSTEVGEPMARNWPGAVGQFSSAALEGTQARHQQCVINPVSQSMDPLASVGKCLPQPGHREKALSLGPRLVRIRRLSGISSGAQRCANVAFCSRQGASVAADAEARWCPDCGCAWYCSAACQATHHGAHVFECQALKSIRKAEAIFEARGVERNKRTMTVLLENALSKQFCMVSQPEALVGCTGLSEDLRLAISGTAQAFLPWTVASDDSNELSDASDDESGRRPNAAGREVFVLSGNSSGSVVQQQQWMAAVKSATIVQVLDWSQMVVIPDDTMRWTVQLDNGHVEALRKSEQPGVAAGAMASRRLFDVRRNQAHTAAGIVRLMSRWVGAAHRAPAIRKVIDDGLIFCVITGLCQTRQFSNRPLTRHAIVSVLAHRMALHVAASQEWRSLAPSLVPPREFMAAGLQGIECAQYSAYFAFLRPLRLPFAEMKSLLPIVCLAWGERAKAALLSLPCPPDRRARRPKAQQEKPSHLAQQLLGGSRRQSARSSVATATTAENVENVENLLSQAHSSSEARGSTLLTEAAAATSATSRGGAGVGGHLTTFSHVASEHLSHVQLVDTVHLDVLTGKVVILCYTSVVEGRSAGDGAAAEDAWLVLLDAARGMQTVALPVPVSQLHRCSL